MQEKTEPGKKFKGEVELIYKTKIKASDRVKLSTSKDAADLLRKTWDENKIDFVEQFKVLLLTRANKVTDIFEASSGGVTGTVVDPKIIFVAATKSKCMRYIYQPLCKVNVYVKQFS